METVGFIGLGNMGSGMAGNIQKADYPLVVYDIRQEVTRRFADQGARPANSPAEVARLSDVTFTSLPGPKEVEEVATGAQGVLEGIKPGSIYVDLSTSRPTLIRRLEPMFRQKGAHVLDAPVSGGKSGAATRNLAVMVGGERAIFERIKPILDAFGDKVFYAGSIGAGSVCNMGPEHVQELRSESVSYSVEERLQVRGRLPRSARRAGGGRVPELCGSSGGLRWVGHGWDVPKPGELGSPGLSVSRRQADAVGDRESRDARQRVLAALEPARPEREENLQGSKRAGRREPGYV